MTENDDKDGESCEVQGEPLTQQQHQQQQQQQQQQSSRLPLLQQNHHYYLSTLDSIAQDLKRQGGWAIISVSDEQRKVFARGFQSGRIALERIHRHRRQQQRQDDDQSSLIQRKKENDNDTDNNSSKDDDDDHHHFTNTIVRCINDKTDDSAHALGYHYLGGMSSRYNAHREGFVFSDGGMFNVVLMEKEEEKDQDKAGVGGGGDGGSTQGTKPDFQYCMLDMQKCLHKIANDVMKRLEYNLDLPSNWFEENYHHQEDHSQWHLKRYHHHHDVTTTTAAATGKDFTSKGTPSSLDSSNNQTTKEVGKPTSSTTTTSSKEEEEEEETTVLLPSHTDPSLLSVVVLDHPTGLQGAMGLQVLQEQQPGRRQENNGIRSRCYEWMELPCCGHAFATIFVGSALSYISGGYLPSAKHRVIQQQQQQQPLLDKNEHEDRLLLRDRMAATFFLRPKGSATIFVPPSPALQGVPPLTKNITFDSWSARVSRNYMKKKNKQEQKQKQKNQTTTGTGSATTPAPNTTTNN